MNWAVPLLLFWLALSLGERGHTAPAPAPLPLVSPPAAILPPPVAPPALPPSVAPPALPPSIVPPSLAPSPAPSSNGGGPLDPAQVAALAQLGISLGANPCNRSLQQVATCDNGFPLSHLLSLELSLCPEGATYPASAWSSLTTLNSLLFDDCPAKAPLQFPSSLINSLSSLTIIQSLGRSVGNELAPGLPGSWITLFTNLSTLYISDTLLNASSPGSVIKEMPRLQELAFINTNLTGPLPALWPSSKVLRSLQITGNEFEGGIPASVGQLRFLQVLDLSSNNLTGTIPMALGNLTSLQALKLSSNKLRGPIPSVLQRLSSLTVLDLSDNDLNGSIPLFLSQIPSLRVIELQNNDLRGQIPFNDTFLMSLNSFKVSGNPLLCYNSSFVSARYVAGLQECSSNGLPDIAAGPEASSPGPSAQPYLQPSSGGRGPNKLVLGVAISLASIAAIIIAAVIYAKCRPTTKT